MPSPKTVLLTGASGFIGRHLSRELTYGGHAVRGLVRGDTDVPGIETIPYEGVHDRHSVRAAAAGAHVLVHLAARVHAMSGKGEDALGEYRLVNVDGSRCVVEEAIAAGVQLVILLSSVKAVGEETGEDPWDESTTPSPVDPYGRSKLEAERVVLDLAQAAGVQAVALRVPLVYGPGMRGNMLRLFKAICRGVPLPVGLVRNRRSLLYVGNLAAAIEAVVAHPEPRSGVYFLSDGKDLSTAALVRAIAAGYGKKPRLLPVPVGWLSALGRVGDLLECFATSPIASRHMKRLTGSLRVSSQRFRTEFSFEPPFEPDAAIRRVAATMDRLDREVWLECHQPEQE